MDHDKKKKVEFSYRATLENYRFTYYNRKGVNAVFCKYVVAFTLYFIV